MRWLFDFILIFQDFGFQYVFGSDVVKNSLELLADHRSNVRREAEAVMSARDTVSASSYFSEAAKKQTQRLREDQERRVEKEKGQRLAELDKASHERALSKQRYCRF